MSARCTGAIFDRYPNGGGEFALALALGDNAHQDGTHIFISTETMAAKSRQSVRAVQMHLRAMLASGWLIAVRRGGGAGRYAEYRISPEWLNGAEIAPFSSATPPPEPPKNGADSAGFSDQKRVQNDAQKGAKRRTPYITERTLIPPTPLAGGAPDVKNRGREKARCAGFEAVEAIYPKRAGMASAIREWDELAPSASLQADIVHAVQAWSDSDEWRRERGRYIPKLAKFLRDKRWLDAPVSPAAAVVEPSPVAQPLTPEQLAANGAKAREAVARAKAMFHGKREAATC